MAFNENSRVKIPTILHLVRLGFEYLSLKGQSWDETTNIFTNIFNTSIKRLNPEFTDGDVKRLYDEVSLSLENEDLGKSFYEKLIATSGTRIIDFENFNNPLGPWGGISSEHWLGVEPGVGRDVFARLILGARTSITIATVSFGLSRISKS